MKTIEAGGFRFDFFIFIQRGQQNIFTLKTKNDLLIFALQSKFKCSEK
ncbi:hypothetical protein QWT87_12855 [Chryseobacterium sp. APV1]|uniref:Uncharacterized protein n=1 Tax=Chryseobacterium urinae TaxID=3058400 RepID=A0ABT8U839_9FLAO|nr:hypothetical protein [Chryseobacterium sp. APV1]MDO3425783.1 hypothetical protein [Chryseobacterium sp. APV1]